MLDVGRGYDKSQQHQQRQQQQQQQQQEQQQQQQQQQTTTTVVKLVFDLWAVSVDNTTHNCRWIKGSSIVGRGYVNFPYTYTTNTAAHFQINPSLAFS